MGPADGAGPKALIDVEVVYCPRPGETLHCRLQLPAGSTLASALAASGWPAQHGLALETLQVGVWSKVRPPETPLRDHDRVEIYRPLTVDPKEARRLRYKGQPSKGRRKVAPAA